MQLKGNNIYVIYVGLYDKRNKITPIHPVVLLTHQNVPQIILRFIPISYILIEIFLLWAVVFGFQEGLEGIYLRFQRIEARF